MQSAAYIQDRDNPTANNSLANYYLNTWFELPPMVLARAEPGSPVIALDQPLNGE